MKTTTLYASPGLLAVILILLFVNIGPVALAQSGTATLTGIVTDESGAFVAGAKAVVTDVGKALRREVTTNGDGMFVLPQLAPSRYRIRVEQHGFAAAELPEVVLNVGEQSTLLIHL
jgi:hypothetical protein